MKVKKKPVEVDARLITESEVVLTAHGRVRAEPGDYVLSDPATGDTWPIKPDIFAATYETDDMITPRSEVQQFAIAMEERLRANDHKGGWSGANKSYLLCCIAGETEELKAAVYGIGVDNTEQEPQRRIWHEAADVANFAMMVADNWGR